MPLYKPDPNNSTKQVPNIQGTTRKDRIVSPTRYVITKTPNFVYCNSDVTLGFFTDSSQSFASKTSEAAGGYSGSAGYQVISMKAGQNLNIHPIAVSGSAADVAKIKFVYKSGLATGGF